MALAGSLIGPGLLARIWEWLHRWALRNATRVIVRGEDMRERIIAKGIAPERVVVARDGAEILPSDAPPEEFDPEVIRTIRGDFHFVLLHAGNLGFSGAWNTFIAAAWNLESAGMGLVFVGYGAQKGQIKASAGAAKNVRFLPFFPASKIPSVLAAGDAHVVTVKRGLEGVVVPSKMYEILAAGKPIVAVAPKETDVASLGIQQGFAVAADPDKPAELVEAVRMLAADRNKLKTMGDAAPAAAPAYDRVAELQKFVEMLDSIAVLSKIRKGR